MATKVKAAQLLVYRAAMAKATQKNYSVEAAMAKLYAAETAMEVTTKAVQLHGGYGYTREYDVERMMRDAEDHRDLRGNIRSSENGYLR